MGRVFLWCGVASLALVSFACGDDDSDDAVETMEPSGDDDSAEGGATGNADDDEQQRTLKMTVECNPDGNGTCENEMDCGPVESGKAREAASACGTMHIGDPEAATTCVVDESNMSPACAGCYVGLINCSVQNCLSACLADPQSAACSECQIEAGCFDDFDECSGFVSLE